MGLDRPISGGPPPMTPTGGKSDTGERKTSSEEKKGQTQSSPRSGDTELMNTTEMSRFRQVNKEASGTKSNTSEGKPSEKSSGMKSPHSSDVEMTIPTQIWRRSGNDETDQ